MAEESLMNRLSAPFPPEAVSWRIGATTSDKTRGLALAYIDARDVMNRLDETLGIFGWKSKHTVVGDRTICKVSIRDPDSGEWISRTDGCGDTDVEAEKGAFSSSLKRCAVGFGIGRYLYDVDSPWVELEKSKNGTPFIPDREKARLRSFLARPASAATRSATSAVASPVPSSAGESSQPSRSPTIERQPTTAAEAADEALAKRLTEIRRRLKRALDVTNETLMPAQVLAINAADLALVEKSLPEAYAKIVAYAKMREAEINTNAAKGPGVPLAQKVQKQLGQTP